MIMKIVDNDDVHIVHENDYATLDTVENASFLFATPQKEDTQRKTKANKQYLFELGFYFHKLTFSKPSQSPSQQIRPITIQVFCNNENC